MIASAAIGAVTPTKIIAVIKTDSVADFINNTGQAILYNGFS
jgi:hypothetical protein